MNLASRSTLLAIVAVVGLVGSYALVDSLGTDRAGAGPQAGGPGAPAVLPVDWCEAAIIAVETLGTIEPGPDALDRGIASLRELRAAAPALGAELDVLVGAYQALADGDLTPLGDPAQVAAVDAAALGVTEALEDSCGLELSGDAPSSS